MDMTPEQEAHLQEIKDFVCAQIDRKYRAGQKEHGGDLWLKAGIIDMAIEEAVDSLVYLPTLRKQMEKSNFHQLYDLKDGENLSHPLD